MQFSMNACIPVFAEGLILLFLSFFAQNLKKMTILHTVTYRIMK